MNQRADLYLDIIHDILEQFQLPEDAQTLSVCSRVCKTWLPIARNHLFADMHLRLVQNVDGVVPRVAPNEKWTEWNGFFKPKYADLSLVKELSISSFNALPILTPPILSSTLTSFPRLQSLRINFARMPIPQSAVDIPIICASLDKLELYNVYIPPVDFCNLLGLFPRLRGLFITQCEFAFPASSSPSPATFAGAPPTLQPSELAITGREEYHSRLLEFFAGSRAVYSIRKFKFGFLQDINDYEQPLNVVRFIEKLKNLESLVWDETPDLPSAGWSPVDPFHAPLTSRVRIFQEQLALVFAAGRNLHSFSMRPFPLMDHWEFYLSIIQSLPQTLRHFEIYLTPHIVNFDFEAFSLAMARLTNLESVRIVVMEWIATDIISVPFKDYVDGLHAGLPELDARGVLKVVWERNRFFFGASDDDLVLMPQEPGTL